jgi:CubicO group peptidase (beta-lactamase class C family)
MTDLRALLQHHVDSGAIPGAVGLVARGGDVEVAAVGSLALGGDPMPPDAVFRIASLTKPIVSAAAMQLVDDGVLALGDPVSRWLPELAAPVVVRTPGGPVEDVVPAVRPITVEHVLTSRLGWGFPAEFDLPAVRMLFEVVHPDLGGPQPHPAADVWVAGLAGVPMLHQPGEGWLYNTAYDVLGVLVERVTGRPLGEVMAERLFEPLGMADTGFAVRADVLHRTATSYRPTADGGLELVETPETLFGSPPVFASGASGLVSTAGDWLAFARMLLAGGTAPDGRRLLSGGAVRAMTTDHLTAAERAAADLFLEGQGWGYGGSVDVAATEPWTVPGRYGWVGGTGTAGYLDPATGTVTALLTQREMTDPHAPPLLRDFWTYAAA